MYFIKLPGSECFARSTFVLDQHRYRSEFRDGHIDQFPHVILLRDIDSHIFCLRSHITQHLFGGFPMSPAAPREDDLGTVRGEALRAGKPDPRACSRHQGHSSIKNWIQHFLPLHVDHVYPSAALKTGRASCRETVGMTVYNSVAAVALSKKIQT